MYVIWRKRKREHYARWYTVGDVRLTPIIAQSRRVNGKPRQEYIACLPSMIESQIDEKNGVWFWDRVEEKLARLTNRISPEEMEKIRAALSKVVPVPDPKFAEELRVGAQAYRDATVAMFTPRDEWARKQSKALNAFSDSRKTAEVCADCGEKLETVYRNRRTFGRGFMGGCRWTTGAMCKKCANDSTYYGFHCFGPCQTCGREVFVSRSIRLRRTFCSVRCGQAHYRKARQTG